VGRVREENLRREEKRREGKGREGEGRKEKRREEKKKGDQKRESLRRKKIQVREKGRKVGSGGLKSRLAKAAGVEPCGQMKDGKVHAVVARSTFRSPNVQNTPTPDQMSKKCTPLRREAHFEVKMLKMLKIDGLGPPLEVEMSKKCTPLWREAHLQVKMYSASEHP